YIVMNELEFRFLAQLLGFDPDGYSTALIDAEWPVYLGILKSEQGLIQAAEAFFADYRIDVEALLPGLPPPDQSLSIHPDP
ncbi:MAG: polar amino acid ABC transporter substrate-binding protein, partial [Pseudomonadota bacterium]|nr:polar amino acid ABC transporter substrate-binding protein [Pseudomonadota bacterium]